MKKFTILICLLLLIPFTLWAGPPAPKAPIVVEADGSPTGRASKIVFPSGSLSKSGGTFTFTEQNSGAVAATDFTGDGDVLVGTGSGTYAAESGATLRTSIGVGLTDSPTFAGLTLSGNLITSTADGPAVVDESASATNPTLIPERSDANTGIGHRYADMLSLVVGGVEASRMIAANNLTYDLLAATEQDVVTGATTNGTTTITKAGENFNTTCAAGDVVIIRAGSTVADYGIYYITTVTDDENLVLNEAPSGSDSDVGFMVFRYGTIVGQKDTHISGMMANVPETHTFTTEGDLPDPLLSSTYLLTGDDDSDNDTVDLQDGECLGQIIHFVANNNIDSDDTCTIGMADTTCTNCPTITFAEEGETATLRWATVNGSNSWVVEAQGNNPEFTSIELGHATDTTLTRPEAGEVDIEGQQIYHEGDEDTIAAAMTDLPDDIIDSADINWSEPITVPGGEKLHFLDSGMYIHPIGDGDLGIVSDVTISSSAPTWAHAGKFYSTTYTSDGSVTDAELTCINTLSSNAQAQIDALIEGPGAVTDTAIVVFDGATGYLAKETPVKIDASGNITGVASLTIDPSATPSWTFSDSDDAAGTASIYANSSGGDNAIIFTLGVEESGAEENEGYLILDGVAETVKIAHDATPNLIFYDRGDAANSARFLSTNDGGYGNIIASVNHSAALTAIEQWNGYIQGKQIFPMTGSTHGGYITRTYSATSGTLAGATDKIELNIPTEWVIKQCQLHVKTAVVDDGGDDTWSSELNDGAQEEVLSAGSAAAQNTNVNHHCHANAGYGGTLTNAETDILLTPNGGNFTAGEIEAHCLCVGFDTWNNE